MIEKQLLAIYLALQQMKELTADIPLMIQNSLPVDLIKNMLRKSECLCPGKHFIEFACLHTAEEHLKLQPTIS